MRPSSWELRLGLGLILTSILIYTLDYIFISNISEIERSIMDSLGFLPLSVLLVTIILNQMIANRSREERLEKMNMVIGTYFSEIGSWLLTYLSDCDPELQELRGDLVNINSWPDAEFSRIQNKLRSHKWIVSMKKIDLEVLRTFLISKRGFMLMLLENPVILEHESFTELLRASFHLAEELTYRDTLKGLPSEDCNHLAVDIERVYFHLVNQWLDYMRYLKGSCPYLFSLAMRTNPFDEDASVVVTTSPPEE
jgi:hypothetical protein